MKDKRYKGRTNGERYEHRAIAAKALGRSLRGTEEVHHVDGRLNNDNLVICPDHAYHMLLHIRQRAFDACGNYNCRKCSICKQWDDPSNLRIYNKNTGSNLVSIVHRACNALRAKRLRRGA